jgi:Leucine-rich repeat (LRR) protein
MRIGRLQKICTQASISSFLFSTEQNNLNGTLPSELSALSALDIMTFGNGDIYGTIPPEFGELSHLTFFQMANNHLTGSIPETFVKLSNMEVFSVFRNQLNGTIPGDFVAATFDLEIVDFALNQFVGSIPDFDNQSSLRLVFMEGNQLTGSIPNTIYSQDSLEILSLSGNQLTGAIRSQIGQLPDLFFLSLEENKFSGSLPTTLGNLLDLADLTLQDNQLTGGIPSQLGELEQIGTVNLSKNRLTGSLPQELGNMEGLKFLSVASNEITGSVPLGFSQLTALEQLFLSNTSISNGLEQAFCNQAILTTSIEADCGSEDPEIDCECCTSCCVNGNDCQLSVPSICQTQAGKFEVDPQRGASCSCSDDGTTLSCTDSTCESCNLDETACAVNTEYGYTFNVTTGSIETFQNTIEYVTGWNGTKITFVEPNEGVCQVSVNGEKCRFCGDLVCSSGFQGYSVFCDNLEGGYNFNSCDEFVVTGYLEILHVYDQSQLSGCPLLLEKV